MDGSGSSGSFVRVLVGVGVTTFHFLFDGSAPVVGKSKAKRKAATPRLYSAELLRDLG